MAFAAKGTDITNPTQTDEAIAYGLEFGRIGMDGASRYLIPQGTNGEIWWGGVGGTWFSQVVDPCRMDLVEVGTKRSLDSHQNMGAWWKEYSWGDG